MACHEVSHLLIPDPGVQHMVCCKHQTGDLQEQTGCPVLEWVYAAVWLPVLVACINQHCQH